MKTKALKNKSPQSTGPKGLLNRLHEVALSASAQTMLTCALATCFGSSIWQTRKKNDARDLLALQEISPYLSVKEIDLSESFRAVVYLDCPIALTPTGRGRLKVAPGAILGLKYCEEALTMPQPGHSFVQILSPNGLWYANVGTMETGQALCLGVTLPAAIPLKEIVLMSFGALSMKTIQIDESDYAGVLNVEAARWWQANRQHIPLTKEPFIRQS